MGLSIIPRITRIFANVTAGVGEQLRFRRISVEMIVRIQQHLGWIRRRLTSAILRAEAGKPPRPSRKRPQRAPDTEAPTRKPYLRKLPLPRREGWLLPLVPCVPETRHAASIYGGHLRIALADPEMAPYLAHPSVLRALRPVCRMLNISNALPPKPPRPPRPKPTAKPVGRISEAQSATATPDASAHPGSPPAAPPPSQTTAKPRPIRRIPPHRLRLPMPRLV